jgi:DNA-binding Lrp family transcriptional regulator
MSIALDRIDKHILKLMQTNARISNLELADQVGLSPTPCSRRVKRLEESGLIAGHVTLLNPDALGLDLTAIIGISMDRHTPDRFENFEQAITRMPEVIECSIVTGQTADFLLFDPDFGGYRRAFQFCVATPGQENRAAGAVKRRITLPGPYFSGLPGPHRGLGLNSLRCFLPSSSFT